MRWDQVGMEKKVCPPGSRPRGEGAHRPIYGDLLGCFEMATKRRQRSANRVIQFEGKPVHSIRTAWVTACRVVNLNLIAHDMRRTAVTNMIEAGIPGDEVMEIVGHRTNAMLRRYMITSEKTAIRVGQRMDAWAREQVQYKTQVQDGLPNKPN